MRFLGVLREGAAIARAPVRVSLEPKAPPTELDEDARRARDEAAAAAAAVAAASKVVKKITDDPEEGESRKTMLRLTDELVESTRVAVKAAAEPYYAEKDPERAITRPDKIPPTLEELCAGKEAIVAELREEVAKHAEKAAAEARLVVVGVGDFVANAAEALTERALRDVTNRVEAAFHRVTAEHTPSARALVARRAEHKRAMRPGLALPARRDELDALLAAEKTRAKEAAAALGAEAEEVAAAIAEAAVDGEGRLARAAHLVARLASDLVTPEDLRADGPAPRRRRRSAGKISNSCGGSDTRRRTDRTAPKDETRHRGRTRNARGRRLTSNDSRRIDAATCPSTRASHPTPRMTPPRNARRRGRRRDWCRDWCGWGCGWGCRDQRRGWYGWKRGHRRRGGGRRHVDVRRARAGVGIGCRAGARGAQRERSRVGCLRRRRRRTVRAARRGHGAAAAGREGLQRRVGGAAHTSPREWRVNERSARVRRGPRQPFKRTVAKVSTPLRNASTKSWKTPDRKRPPPLDLVGCNKPRGKCLVRHDCSVPCQPVIPARVPAGTRTHRRAPCGRRSRLRAFPCRRGGRPLACARGDARAFAPTPREAPPPRPWASRRSSTSGTSPTRGARSSPGACSAPPPPAERPNSTPRRCSDTSACAPFSTCEATTSSNPTWDWSRMFEMCAFKRGDDADASFTEWSRAVGADAAERRLVRYHAPLLDYDRYYAEIFRRMSTWEKAKAVAFTAQAKLVDPTNQRRLFVGKVNDGGLYLLNEVMLDSSGPEIRAALQVMSNVTEDAPLAFYCKAGKDRTGIVAALALHCCGVSEDDIVADYHRSDAAGSSALGGGKIERGLSIDYSRFRGAPKEVMEHALEHARRKHGSVDGYLDSIGFDSDARYRLARALCS